VRGAYLNVRTNATSLDDKAAVDDFLARGGAMQDRAVELEREILAIVEGRL
jgi:glutamate formiminotransferase/formiminotetrahydrofolate cyclodeaminase